MKNKGRSTHRFGVRHGDASKHSLPLLVSRCAAYQGSDVIIEWVRPEDDWPSYRLLTVDVEKHRVRLKGIDSPDGGKHRGDTFWAPIAEITDIYPFPANAKAEWMTAARKDNQ